MSELIASLGIIVALGVLGYAYSVYNGMKSLPEGNEKMKEIASAIHEGAMVFLRSEYKQLIGIYFDLGGPKMRVHNVINVQRINNNGELKERYNQPEKNEHSCGQQR